MNSKREQFSTTLTTKFINILRKHAFVDNRITMSEMIEIYQQSYLKDLEVEKAERKLQKELKEKGEVTCPKCNQTTSKIVEDKETK